MHTILTIIAVSLTLVTGLAFTPSAQAKCEFAICKSGVSR